MKIALLCSNTVVIDEQTKKGTEIFVRILCSYLKKYTDFSFTAFASSDSKLPIPTESFGMDASIQDVTMPLEKHVIFELALLAKALQQQEAFDLYHVHIGDGDIVLPFAKFIKKPLLITIHHTYDLPYLKKYLSLFSDLENVYYISVSNAQRNILPNLNYIQTIYHGIEEKLFEFSETGGEHMMWAGRGIPTKGLDIACEIAKATKTPLTACIIRKPHYKAWLENVIENAQDSIEQQHINLLFDVKREALINMYQKSKLFLFPLQWDEPFGLVLIEALATGTPVIAYARGAIPEIVIDGKTGFLVNSSDTDIHGDYIIKKTGKAGLIEAVERVYNLSEHEYKKMRRACRELVEEKFTASRMAQDYINLYRKFQ